RRPEVGLGRINLEVILTNQVAPVNQRNPSHRTTVRVTGPKQTWLKENQTRAVEFSRNNRSSRTSASRFGCLLFRGRRLRFRFVVSLLYQVFRAPPNRRFVVVLIGVKPVCFVCFCPNGLGF
ncbi:hypothetical protein, partial [Nocardiopsis tropica]